MSLAAGWKSMAVGLGMALLSAGSAHAAVPKSDPLSPVPIPLSKAPVPPLPPAPATKAAPAGNPGGWVTSDDYPPVAMRFGLSGMVSFRLFIDPAGKVFYCQISDSSGFDILDEAACDLLSRRAMFKPARDRKGQAVADIWNSRFVWKLPQQEPQPLIDRRQLSILGIDRFGTVKSCEDRNEGHGDDGEEDGFCLWSSQIPSLTALAMRGYGNADLKQVEVESNFALDPDKRDQLLSDKPGYETSSLMAWRIDIDRWGKVSGCAMERQRGSAALINDMCRGLASGAFEPRRDASGTAIATPAWFVMRMSYRKDR